MKRYLKLFLALYKNNFVIAMEFRSSFFIALGVTMFQILLQLWLVDIFFRYTDRILDWTRSEVFVLVGMFRVVKGIFDMFLRKNLFGFPHLINQGDFDLILSKPVNSLFLVSLRQHVVTELSAPISGLVILIYALVAYGFNFSVLSIINIVLLNVLSLVSFYCFFAIFSTLAIFVSRLSAINEFQDVVSQTVRFPLDVLTHKSQILEILLLPLMIMFTYPVKILLGKVPAYHLVLELVFVTAIFVLLIKFWNFALKRYSSASS